MYNIEDKCRVVVIRGRDRAFSRFADAFRLVSFDLAKTIDSGS
jgi:hypothetical protein